MINNKNSKIDPQSIQEAIEKGKLKLIKSNINKNLSPAETAQLLESILPNERMIIWECINLNKQADVLALLSYDIQHDLLEKIELSKLVEMLSSMETDNLADILQELPNTMIERVLDQMSPQNRERVEKIISYPKDSAGGLMNTDIITTSPDITIKSALKVFQKEAIPDRTDMVYITNTNNKLIGTMPITDFFCKDSNQLVEDKMEKNFIYVKADENEEKISQIFLREGLTSLAVVDEKNKLLGRITFDDMLDTIYESGANTQVTRVQIDETADVYASVRHSISGRLIWLGINLITAFIGSFVIDVFKESIQQVVALAVLLPIVASMGGIAGTQTLSIMIRGMALNQIQPAKISWLVNREVQLALTCGVLLAIVIGSSVYWWFGDNLLGLIISIAIIINLVAAGITGVFLPYLLKLIGVDPALAGGVVLTTVTDVVGFASFLGLATIFYL